MADWVTDDQLYDAADRCARKLLEMCADAIGDPNKTPPDSLPGAVVNSLYLDAEDFMFFDPARIDEEYARMLAVAKAVGSDPHAAADLEETKNHLINWTGDAATAFKRQVDIMKEYCDLQQLNILQAMLHLIAAGQLAVHARADCLELFEATIAAAQKEIDDRAERAATAMVSIGAGIIKGVLDMDAKSLIAGTLGILSRSAVRWHNGISRVATPTWWSTTTFVYVTSCALPTAASSGISQVNSPLESTRSLRMGSH